VMHICGAKNTASIVLEILFIEHFTTLTCKPYDIMTDMTDPILRNRKMSISLKQKKVFQREKHHSSAPRKASHISQKIFHVIYTLMRRIIKIHRHSFIGQSSYNILSEFQSYITTALRQ